MPSAFVTPPARNDTRSATADWMELQALRSTRRRSTIGDLLGVFDIFEDAAASDSLFGEDEATGDEYDQSIIEIERNRLIDRVFDELYYRQQVLGDAYPFSVRKSPLPSNTYAELRRLLVMSSISSACWRHRSGRTGFSLPT